MLKEPGYVHWLLEESVTGPLLALKKEVDRLIKKFDQKPFQGKCNGNACSAQASQLSVYGNNLLPYWWCDNCDPYQTGAVSGKLQIFRSYSVALSHVELYCVSRQSEYKELIKTMAQAKGLPSRVGEPQAVAFFK